jgi:hypothetical protein
VPSVTSRTEGFVEASGRPSLLLPSEVELAVGRNPVPLEHRDRKISSVEVSTETSTFAPVRDPADWSGAYCPSPLRYEELVLKGRLPWAELLQRVFEVDALACPKCGGRMRVLAAITDPTVAARILRCLGLASRAPPLATSGDGAGHADSAEDESFGGMPEFDFDQSRPCGEDKSSA